MNSFNICEKCDEIYLSDKCHCKPYVIYKPNLNETKTVYALSFKEAVKKEAEKIMNKEKVFDEDLFEEPVEVTDENGVMKKFNCSASLVINYHVEEIK